MFIIYGVLLGLLQLWEAELLADESDGAQKPDEQHSVVGSSYQSQYQMDGYPPAVNSFPPQAHAQAAPAPTVTNTDFAPAVDKRM